MALIEVNDTTWRAWLARYRDKQRNQRKWSRSDRPTVLPAPSVRPATLYMEPLIIPTEEQARWLYGRPLLAADVIASVADRHGLTVADLHRVSRSYAIAHPRQEAMYLIRAICKYGTPRIGGLFDGMDHSTVVHGVRAFAARHQLPPAELIDVGFALDIARHGIETARRWHEGSGSQ